MAPPSELESVRGAHPILLFDGVCNLCAGLTQFLIERDDDRVLRFAPLQSDVGQALLEEFEISTDETDSVVLVDGDACYTKSDAVIRTAAHLGGVYRVAVGLGVVPRVVRDWGYDRVAASRYSLFGKKDSRMIPSPDVEDRFLDAPIPNANTDSESD